MKRIKKFVIDLGGSIAFPEKINPVRLGQGPSNGVNIAFLRRFYFFIKREIKKGSKFVIVIGGGRCAREYQRAISKIAKVSDADKHWIGICATRLNACFLKTAFNKESHPIIFDERFKIRNFGKYPIIIGAGWKPHQSTDAVAVQIAIDFKIKQVIILGKPAYVYTVDPEKDKTAKPIKKMAWRDYLKMIPSRCTPGLHAPVDPVAARLARKNNIEAIIAYGNDLKNLKKILMEKKFKGTSLSNQMI